MIDLKLIVFIVLFNLGLSYPLYREFKKSKPKLILILADGIRHDYVNDPNLKGFKKIASKGVKAEYVKPIFPANSYPNWYTIITGLYSESHGMVQNFMYDSEYNETFLMSPHPSASNPHWWNSAEPLWVTAEKQGIRTAVYWWDGCQVKIRNMVPSFCLPPKSFWTWKTFKKDTRAAFDEILKKFEDDEWDMAFVYYEAVDAIGHAFGSETDERIKAMRDLDELIYQLDSTIELKSLDHKVSTVIVSDHGMLTVDEFDDNVTEIIEIEDIIDDQDVSLMLDRGSTSMLIPKPGKEKKILQELNETSPKGLRFYAKEVIPEYYHFKHNPRVSPILFVAEQGYFLRGFSKRGKTKPIPDVLYPGHHGYDPVKVEKMRTIMFATGPRLKSSYISKPLLMTDHYNLICYLVDIEPQPNNGSWLRVQDMIKVSEAPIQQSTHHFKSDTQPLHICNSLILFFLIILKSTNYLRISDFE